MSRVRPPVKDAHGNLTFKPNHVDPLCDFCCWPEAVPIAALLVGSLSFWLPDDPQVKVSTGAWYVCPTCLALVMAHNALGLAHRALANILRRMPLPARLLNQAQLEEEILEDVLRVQSVALDQLKDWPC